MSAKGKLAAKAGVPSKAKAKSQSPKAAAPARLISRESLMDADTQDGNESTASSALRRRCNAGHYVMRRTTNPVEEDEEKSKFDLIEFLKQPEFCMFGRTLGLLLRNGEIQKWHARRYGQRGDTLAADDVAWNPQGKWTTWQHIPVKWKEREVLKIEGMGELIEKGKQVDRYFVNRVFLVCYGVSRPQPLPEGFHQQGCMQMYLQKIREKRSDYIDSFMSSINEGKVPWREIGCAFIEKQDGGDNEPDKVWLKLKWPQCTPVPSLW